MGVEARVAVELDIASARELVKTIEAAIEVAVANGVA